MAYMFYECKVINIIDMNDVVKKFFIKVPDEIPFRFKAGQFVMLDLPIDSKISNRSYSIASAPSEDNIFELCIALNLNGTGTPYLFHHVKTGDTIKVSKVLGKFILPSVIEDDICFICTGTGIAPLRSQIHEIFNNNIPHKNIHMIFGNRWTKDILYREEMEDLEQKYPEFKFIPVLSRDNPNWNGRKGYVHPVYEEIFADKRPAYFYICGWSNMLREARQRLKSMGYDKQRIRLELYD